MTPVVVERGEGPVILGMPHVGTWLPEGERAALNANGRLLADTDWHVDRLYAGLLPSATIVRATFHRYLVDANRDPGGGTLYPGQNTTGLVPGTDFDGVPVRESAPDGSDIAARIAQYHAPYHAALLGEIERIRARHGIAILWDCHSIRSVIPFLFPGTLPDLNIGTNGGTSCAPDLAAIVEAEAAASGFTWVRDGRFRGGWTTRHHGRPAEGVHAIQMELAQATHLETEAPPFAYSPAKAERLRPVLAAMLAALESRALKGKDA